MDGNFAHNAIVGFGEDVINSADLELLLENFGFSSLAEPAIAVQDIELLMNALMLVDTSDQR